MCAEAGGGRAGGGIHREVPYIGITFSTVRYRTSTVARYCSFLELPQRPRNLFIRAGRSFPGSTPRSRTCEGAATAQQVFFDLIPNAASAFSASSQSCHMIGLDACNARLTDGTAKVRYNAFTKYTENVHFAIRIVGYS